MNSDIVMEALSPDLRLRTRRLNQQPIREESEYVLCWLQQAIRSTDNPIIDAAIGIGNALRLPVVVYHGIDNRYPHASHRLHRFLLEASSSLDVGLAKRGLRFCRFVRRPGKREPNLVHRLADSAACVVSDDMPTFVAKQQAMSVAQKLDCPMLVTDAATAVPMASFNKLISTTKGFRAAHRPLRQSSVADSGDAAVVVKKYQRQLCFEHDDIDGATTEELDELIRACRVDMTVGPCDWCPGDRASAEITLQAAIDDVIPRYKWTRNNPSLENSSSWLSPYLHFGVLGPREVVNAIDTAELHSAARWKFFDELLTWREWFYHLARFSEDPTSYENVPAWARKTLADHIDDPRETIYSLDDLIHARTADDVWNVAQRQFTIDGWMHNNLRMYWVKQIIRWRPTPEDAWQTACYLNDRFSLDGRDPATYGNMQWGFGRAKRGYREIPIYGWVSPKSAAPLLKRAGMQTWIAEQLGRPMPEIKSTAEKARVR